MDSHALEARHLIAELVLSGVSSNDKGYLDKLIFDKPSPALEASLTIRLKQAMTLIILGRKDLSIDSRKILNSLTSDSINNR